MSDIQAEPNFGLLRFLHFVFNTKDVEKIKKMIKKQKTDEELNKLYHPYMFLNGRNLCYFFSENYDIVKILTDRL